MIREGRSRMIVITEDSQVYEGSYPALTGIHRIGAVVLFADDLNRDDLDSVLETVIRPRMTDKGCESLRSLFQDALRTDRHPS